MNLKIVEHNGLFWIEQRILFFIWIPCVLVWEEYYTSEKQAIERLKQLISK